MYPHKFFTHKEGCWLINGAGKEVGRDILISIPFLPTACSAFIQSQMSWDTRQYDLTLHPTPQLTRPDSLPTMCFKIYMMASSSPQNTDAIPPKILHAIDLLPLFGVCEDSKMGLFTTLCQIPSKFSLWCCPKESQVWMPVTGSVSVEGTSF